MLPCYCPSCRSELKVERLYCENCKTRVEGLYKLPTLALLSREEQEFVLKFVKHSGSLKEMSKELELSYPTVRNLLNELIDNIKEIEDYGKK